MEPHPASAPRVHPHSSPSSRCTPMHFSLAALFAGVASSVALRQLTARLAPVASTSPHPSKPTASMLGTDCACQRLVACKLGLFGTFRAGYYVSSAGSSVRAACPRGTYSATSTATGCSTCQNTPWPGLYQDQVSTAGMRVVGCFTAMQSVGRPIFVQALCTREVRCLHACSHLHEPAGPGCGTVLKCQVV